MKVAGRREQYDPPRGRQGLRDMSWLPSQPFDTPKAGTGGRLHKARADVATYRHSVYPPSCWQWQWCRRLPEDGFSSRVGRMLGWMAGLFRLPAADLMWHRDAGSQHSRNVRGSGWTQRAQRPHTAVILSPVPEREKVQPWTVVASPLRTPARPREGPGRGFV